MIRKVLVIQPAPLASYESEMNEEEFEKIKSYAADHARKTVDWLKVPSWCKHVVASVEYGGNRATVYVDPFLCDTWAWEAYFTNPSHNIEFVKAFHRGTSRLNGQAS